MKNRNVFLALVAAMFAVLSVTTFALTQSAHAGTIMSVTGPTPPSVTVGGNTVITVNFNDDVAGTTMSATVGVPNNFTFTAATVTPACSAVTSGIGTGGVVLNDPACDANTTSEPLVWTLVLTCNAPNTATSPTTTIAITGGSVGGSGDTKVDATCTPANTPPPTQVFECFNAQRGPDAAATVRLITQNFGGDLVRVRNLVMMCELAFKVKPPIGTTDVTPPLPDPASVRIFACYRLDRGDDPNDPYTLTTDNFGADKVTVRDSNVMCEEGSKTRVKTTTAGPPITTVTGTPTGVVWQCFRIAGSKEGNAPFRLLTNNFGREDVRILRGVGMCEEAAKQRIDATGAIVESGKATGNVLECFAVRSSADPKAPVVLETKNFGKANTVIRQPVMMCEPGKKTPQFTFTGPENPQPEELHLGDGD